MDNSPNLTPQEALGSVLDNLADAIEQALETVASAGAHDRFAEVGRLCREAAAIAKAGERLTAERD